jgi:hypothetical protein
VFHNLFRRIRPASDGLKWKRPAAQEESAEADCGAHLARRDRYLRRWSDGRLRNGSHRNSEES